MVVTCYSGYYKNGDGPGHSTVTSIINDELVNCSIIIILHEDETCVHPAY
jgi:hypothetical protein